ncbi:MAG TPA: hypothetical protein VG621_01125 [Candidatus Paceibacterota bacterium]|nr:hypothetical protein [Candidatus Paceibacterota bacterium]
MLFLIASDNRTFRSTHIAPLQGALELIVYDDTYGTLAELEQYAYPSLFNAVAPMVLVKFMLTDTIEAPSLPFLKKLLASPTTFIFEELTVASSVVTAFKKAGAVVEVDEKRPSAKKEAPLFSVTGCITAADKKTRWMTYRSALETYAVEAIVGVLYWKVRDLIAKQPHIRNRYRVLYEALITAHMQAWEKGIPLELAIERVILEQ